MYKDYKAQRAAARLSLEQHTRSFYSLDLQFASHRLLISSLLFCPSRQAAVCRSEHQIVKDRFQQIISRSLS